jgi:hypothetical protein
MRQTSFAAMHRSLARSLELVGDWWSPLILRDLAIGGTAQAALTDVHGDVTGTFSPASATTSLAAAGLLRGADLHPQPGPEVTA